MLRRTLLGLADSDRARRLVTSMPVSSSIVSRFVPGESAEAAVAATRRLVDSGLLATLDHLGEDTVDRAHADVIVQAYLTMLGRLREAGLSDAAEVSVKLSAVGQALPGSGEKIALDNARTICQAARNAGTTVTLDMEDHTTTDSTLAILSELRADFPETGAVVQAYLHRTEADCRDLAYEGFPCPALQGRVPGTRVGRVPEQGPGRPFLCPLPEGADERRRIPDGGLP